MEKHYFWALFIIALVLGFAFGISYMNARITAKAISSTETQVTPVAPVEPVAPVAPVSPSTTQTQQLTWWQRILGRQIQTPAGFYCRDSDNGINLAIKGTCVDSEGSHYDDCINTGMLKEWYCVQNSYCSFSQYSCSSSGYSCYNGACIPASRAQIQQPSALRSDRLNIIEEELSLCKEIIYRTEMTMDQCIDLCEGSCHGDPKWCSTTCIALCSKLPSSGPPE